MSGRGAETPRWRVGFRRHGEKEVVWIPRPVSQADAEQQVWGARFDAIFERIPISWLCEQAPDDWLPGRKI